MRYATTVLTILLLAPVSQGYVEITPFGGHQGGGEFENDATGIDLELEDDSVYGLMLGFGQSKSAPQLELYFSRQETELEDVTVGGDPFELDVDYYHIGGTYGFGDDDFVPFIAASLGATRFDPEFSAYDSETKFSLSLGGGVKWFFTERIGLRLEGRVFGTFIDSDGEAFSGPDGGIIIVGNTDVLVQYNVIAGLIFVLP